MSRPSEPAPEEEPRGGFFLNVVPAVLYVLAVFYGGGLNDAAHGPDLRHSDKILHAAAFAGMVFVIRRALRWLSPDWPEGRVLVLSAMTSATLGGLLELYQMALPHRSAEWLDFLADAVGAAAAAALIWRANRAQRTQPAA